MWQLGVHRGEVCRLHLFSYQLFLSILDAECHLFDGLDCPPLPHSRLLVVFLLAFATGLHHFCQYSDPFFGSFCQGALGFRGPLSSHSPDVLLFGLFPVAGAGSCTVVVVALLATFAGWLVFQYLFAPTRAPCYEPQLHWFLVRFQDPIQVGECLRMFESQLGVGFLVALQHFFHCL